MTWRLPRHLVSFLSPCNWKCFRIYTKYLVKSFIQVSNRTWVCIKYHLSLPASFCIINYSRVNVTSLAYSKFKLSKLIGVTFKPRNISLVNYLPDLESILTIIFLPLSCFFFFFFFFLWQIFLLLPGCGLIPSCDQCTDGRICKKCTAPYVPIEYVSKVRIVRCIRECPTGYNVTTNQDYRNICVRIQKGMLNFDSLLSSMSYFGFLEILVPKYQCNKIVK